MAAVSGGIQTLSIERPSLSVVATPIGNLSDITLRAIATLASVDLLLAEDTRVVQRLLQRHGIDVRVSAVHEHNEAGLADALAKRIADERLAVALVSDAGTPLIADPGYRLVRAAHAAAIPVRVVPGACAAIAALSIAGLATDRFAFEGFLPARAAARRERLRALVTEARTLVFYEAPHRVRDTVADFLAVFGGEREVAIAREITKLHETVYRGPLETVAAAMAADANASRGEFVLVVAGAAAADTAEPDLGRAKALVEALADHVSRRDAVRIVAGVMGVNRNRLYALTIAPDSG